MDKKKKIILIISIITLSIILLIGGSIAFFGWTAEEEATIDVAVVSGTGECSLSYDNNIFIEPSTTRNGGRIIRLKAKQEVGNKATIAWNMKIKEIGTLQDASFKYEMINTSTGESYGTGTFENITVGSTITFINENEILGFGLDYEFTLYLWIDGNASNHQLSMANQTLDFDIACNIVSTEEGTVSVPYGNLKTYIKNLYTTNNPIEVNDTVFDYDQSGEITYDEEGYELIIDRTYYYSYLDTNNTWGIMNDGLDSSGNLTGNKNQGNIRYFGNNPNNYIYFNCSDYDDTSTCERWRIVGIVDGKVKIMKDSSIGVYAFDEENSQNWSYSTLNTLLNEGAYYTGLQQKNSQTLNLISSSTWYLGSNHHFYINPNEVYDIERGTSTWEGNIALLYPSDYGYAADLNKCKVPFGLYSNCSDNNWMTNILTANQSNSGWIIFEDLTNNNAGWLIVSNGNISSEEVIYEYEIVPTLYLDENISISSGDGSFETPYQIHIEPTPLSDFIYVTGDNIENAPVTTYNDTVLVYDVFPDEEDSFDSYYKDVTITISFPHIFNALYNTGEYGYGDFDLNIGNNDIFLLEYTGESKNVYIPNNYELDGKIYNVINVKYKLNDDTEFYGGDDNECYIRCQFDSEYNIFTKNEVENVTFGSKVRTLELKKWDAGEDTLHATLE